MWGFFGYVEFSVSKNEWSLVLGSKVIRIALDWGFLGPLISGKYHIHGMVYTGLAS